MCCATVEKPKFWATCKERRRIASTRQPISSSSCLEWKPRRTQTADFQSTVLQTVFAMIFNGSVMGQFSKRRSSIASSSTDKLSSAGRSSSRRSFLYPEKFVPMSLPGARAGQDLLPLVRSNQGRGKVSPIK